MRQNFRVVDLMFVIGISALLFGLMVPALQMGSRCVCRIQCQNNLKNIALALNAYQIRQEAYPASYLTSLGHSFVPFLLPDLDEQTLYNEYNFSQSNLAEENRKVIDKRMNVLVCPVASNGDSIPAAEVLTGCGQGMSGNSLFAPTHYAINWGGGRGEWGHDFVMKYGQNRGVSMEDRGVAPKEITDGMATTPLIGEKPSAHGWAIGGWAASEFDVGPGPIYAGNSRVGSLVYTGSNHANGSNFAFCDGSVQRISKGLNQNVWYALITRDGGEKLDLDIIDW